jgi:hypothetical protein
VLVKPRDRQKYSEIAKVRHGEDLFFTHQPHGLVAESVGIVYGHSPALRATDLGQSNTEALCPETLSNWSLRWNDDQISEGCTCDTVIRAGPLTGDISGCQAA